MEFNGEIFLEMFSLGLIAFFILDGIYHKIRNEIDGSFRYKELPKLCLTDEDNQIEFFGTAKPRLKDKIGYIEMSFEGFLAVTSVCQQWDIVVRIGSKSRHCLYVTEPEKFQNLYAYQELYIGEGTPWGYASPVAALVKAIDSTSLIVMKTRFDQIKFKKYIRALSDSATRENTKQEEQENNKLQKAIQSGIDSNSIRFCNEVKMLSKIQQECAENEFAKVEHNLTEQYGLKLDSGQLPTINEVGLRNGNSKNLF